MPGVQTGEVLAKDVSPYNRVLTKVSALHYKACAGESYHRRTLLYCKSDSRERASGIRKGQESQREEGTGVVREASIGIVGALEIIPCFDSEGTAVAEVNCADIIKEVFGVS